MALSRSVARNVIETLPQFTRDSANVVADLLTQDEIDVLAQPRAADKPDANGVKAIAATALRRFATALAGPAPDGE